ncbi:uncharacterized protein V6R79_017995 [Siganus canaliculatus]
MAEPGRTVRVSGLPTDTEDNRLKDKLFIHFLRAKNGGGEIESVTIVRETPVSALITFEDSRVAQSVVQRSRHILQVDDDKYEVSVTEHHERIEPDKVILSLSAKVNHSKLPGGVAALTSLQKNHPDIQINYDAAVELYTIDGSYSKVQAALAQLLEGPQSEESKDSNQAATRSHPQEVEDQSGKSNKQRERREKVPNGRPSAEYSSSPGRDMTPGGNSWEDTGQTEGAALQLPEHPATPEEDFLLIVDADMFRYLQKHCRKEYQQILRRYGIDVVDMTTQGLTSLFLQAAPKVEENGHEQESLESARKALSAFFQENETKIRRAQLPKSILSTKGGIQKAKEDLSIRLPKLLLNEDKQNIYIIGSSSDVSDAKQFLLNHGAAGGKSEDVASLLRFPSYGSGSSPHAEEHTLPPPMTSSGDSVDDGIDQQRSGEDERRAEGARRYKLAARFKDTGLTALGSRPVDFSLRGGLSFSSKAARLGPMLGYDVLSEPAETTGERRTRALAQKTGADILFKSGDALPSTAAVQNKISLSPHLIDARPKSLASPLDTAQPSFLQSTPLPPAGSGSSLRRASSFSGTPQQKTQVVGQRSQDDASKATVRSSQSGKGKPVVYTAEITVSFVIWMHIKEAYSARVDDLTSDVQVKESRPEGSSSDLIITLKGANSSEVSARHLALQRLVDSVSADFCVKHLTLSELGISDGTDETLLACCADVRSKFKKVTIQILKDSLFLLGPKQLCTQVGVSLREVFSGDLAQIAEHQGPSTMTRRPSSSLQAKDQSTSPRSSPQVKPSSQTNKADWTDSIQEKRPNNRSDLEGAELVNGGAVQPSLRKDPVIKEKVKLVGTLETERQKTEILVNHPETGNDKSLAHVNGVGSRTAPSGKDRSLHPKDNTQQQQPEADDTRAESGAGFAGPGCICVCGESGKWMVRTNCGATLCSKCLDAVHGHCKVCHVETEPTVQGIQGKIRYSKLHIKVPGYTKDSAIKISYCIPDGIQEEGHPSPGKPFKGGNFEAFLPDCDQAKKLLPRLEKAFKQGLTFTVIEKETRAKVTWDGIPHKTSLYGGKSGNGYPDSTYLSRLSEVLKSHGIEDPSTRVLGD